MEFLLPCATCEQAGEVEYCFPVAAFKAHNEAEHPFNTVLCTICPNVFSTISERDEHVAEAHRKQLCIQCLTHPGTEFYMFESQFHEHYKELHKEAKLPCHNCPNKFSPKSKLDIHLEHWHNEKVKKEPKIPCFHCGGSFPGKEGIETHNRECHPGFDLACHKCFSVFRTQKQRDHHSKNCKFRCT